MRFTFIQHPISISALLALIILGPRQGFAEVIETVDFQHYFAFPKTVRELRREIGRYSGSSKYTGFTRWNVTYRYAFEETKAGCRLRDVRVNLDIHYKMPKLFPAYKEAAVKIEFDRYYDRLMEHERGHGDNGRKAARAVDETLSSLSAPNYLALRETPDREARELIREYRARDKHYDRVTSHGRYQERYSP